MPFRGFDVSALIDRRNNGTRQSLFANSLW
jgi:hypothetical protein